MERIVSIYESACKEAGQKTVEFSRFISVVEFGEEDEDDNSEDLCISEDSELNLPPSPPLSASEKLALAILLEEEEESDEGSS